MFATSAELSRDNSQHSDPRKEKAEPHPGFSHARGKLLISRVYSGLLKGQVCEVQVSL